MYINVSRRDMSKISSEYIFPAESQSPYLSWFVFVWYSETVIF